MSSRLLSIAAASLILLASVFTHTAVGQSNAAGTMTIIGSVVDTSLNPVGGAAVSLVRNGQIDARATSAADGSFAFRNVGAGAFKVRVQHPGFPAFEREGHGRAGATLRLPVVLAKAGETLKATPPVPATDGVAAGAASNRQTAQGGVPPNAAPVAVPSPPPAAATTAGAGRSGSGGGGAGGRGMAMVAPPSAFERADGYPGHARTVQDDAWSGYRYHHSREQYAHVDPNRFQSALTNPLSTFGADVDTASYANVRRFLSRGQRPVQDAVRVEELINYFRFDYDAPRDGRPIAITTEVGDCPWAPSHKLVLVGARARTSAAREIEGRNIVLLLDVSGSMAPEDRLPLLKSALRMFVDTLQPRDTLAIVTYAGTSGLALAPTPLTRRAEVQRVIDNLSAGGSTNGAQGLVTAYRVAREAYVPGGVNRVILATDGDFNVGIVDRRDLLRLIERERESGVFLSVLGVGTGNLNDATMELLADRGNGHYAYIDSLQEARRVLVREGDSTLETVAKDVKFQVEFNPTLVHAWKLIGYENRLMAAQDFNDDRKDGGEMGAGHTVTVLYEVVPAGVAVNERDVDALRYQPAAPATTKPAADKVFASEWLTVKARYKMPEGETSQLITQPVQQGTSRARHLPVAAALADFGLLLRSSSDNSERWDSLLSYVRRLQPPPAQETEFAEFRELVAIARGLRAR